MSEIDDPYLWLEEVAGEAALDWARERNARTMADFTETIEFTDLSSRILAMLDADDRIAYPARRGPWLYNFWRDADHPKGLWRRTTPEQYRTDDPDWDVLIDVDALAEGDDENWVWQGARVLRPEQSRALVMLSRGGADAHVVREFDLETRHFLDSDDNHADGFELSEAKSWLAWIDHDTVYVGTDFGPGSLTDSGYPRVAKRWRRGTPLSEATTVFGGEPSDVSVSAGYDRTPGYERHFVGRATDFFNEEVSVLESDGSLCRVDVPTDADVSWYRNWLLVFLHSPWTINGNKYSAGTLLGADFEAFLDGDRRVETVFTPTDHTSLHDYGWTENHLILTTLSDVATALQICTPGPDGWITRGIEGAPDHATTSVMGLDPLDGGDEFLLATSGFTMPASLLAGAVDTELQLLAHEPEYFDTGNVHTEQFFATSKDGTRIPYFVTRRAGVTGPTVLSGYGGFGVSRTPAYSAGAGMGWLELGGISVLANIRGGAEYGPAWHTQTQKQGRHKVYEDFAAVAADLVNRGITTPAQLGAMGGSNGGLLMGVMLTRYPELFGALVCQVPLLDMKRYHLLLAGASWMAEYGDPDNPQEWAFLRDYSPYQLALTRPPVDTAGGPPILFTTSTRDDRVHPGHARKMAALLEEHGAQVWYYENIEGGHSGAADNKQTAFRTALVYRFLATHLMK